MQTRVIGAGRAARAQSPQPTRDINSASDEEFILFIDQYEALRWKHRERHLAATCGPRWRPSPLALNLFPFHPVGMSGAHEDLQYTVEEWTTDNSRIIEVLARAGSLSVAYAAYWAALAARPRSRIVLRQRALELAARDPLR